MASPNFDPTFADDWSTLDPSSTTGGADQLDDIVAEFLANYGDMLEPSPVFGDTTSPLGGSSIGTPQGHDPVGVPVVEAPMGEFQTSFSPGSTFFRESTPSPAPVYFAPGVRHEFRRSVSEPPTSARVAGESIEHPPLVNPTVTFHWNQRLIGSRFNGHATPPKSPARRMNRESQATYKPRKRRDASEPPRRDPPAIRARGRTTSSLAPAPTSTPSRRHRQAPSEPSLPSMTLRVPSPTPAAQMVWSNRGAVGPPGPGGVGTVAHAPTSVTVLLTREELHATIVDAVQAALADVNLTTGNRTTTHTTPQNPEPCEG